jgi:hypothetical protein
VGWMMGHGASWGIEALGSSEVANQGRPMWVWGLAIWHVSGNSPNKKAPTAAFPLVRNLSVWVGDTGFEPVTSSV